MQELAKGFPLRWEMIEECGSQRVGGVERIPWKRLFQTCTLFPHVEKLGKPSCGIKQGKWITRTLYSQDLPNND